MKRFRASPVEFVRTEISDLVPNRDDISNINFQTVFSLCFSRQRTEDVPAALHSARRVLLHRSVQRPQVIPSLPCPRGRHGGSQRQSECEFGVILVSIRDVIERRAFFFKFKPSLDCSVRVCLCHSFHEKARRPALPHVLHCFATVLGLLVRRRSTIFYIIDKRRENDPDL